MSALAGTARATARSERQGWLASLKGETVSFLKGDNNAPWAILAETVIGCVPVLGQLVDARDIIKGLIEVSGAPASPLAWFNLITALIGLIPGGGDAAKRSLRAVKSGAISIDGLLDMIRHLYKGDPEKLLKEVLDVSAVRRKLNEILDNPALLKQLGPEARKSIDDIKRNLNAQFDAFKKEVDGWLAKGRKTSADTGTPARVGTGTPAAKPATEAKAGTNARTDHASPASPNTPNTATRRAERIKTLPLKMLGVLGEHMADYHCQEIKGWGEKAAHDQGKVNPAKLNDKSCLVQLWPVVVRGRGIDAVWKSNGPKPYAVIEAKASYDPSKSLKALLGEAWDKTEKDAAQPGSSTKRGRTKKNGAVSSDETPATRQTNGKVTQMSHGWIQLRLQSIALSDPVAKFQLLRDRQKAYSRHVLFFSISQAISHAEALIMHIAKQSVQDGMHGTHQATREWGDSDIEKVVDNRAGYSGTARDKRTR